MKKLIFAIPLFFILLLGEATKGQVYPSEYYDVINKDSLYVSKDSTFNKDSLYVFSSDTHILFFSSPGEDGNFSYLSSIKGNFTASTNMAFNDEYFIIENSDTLFLFDISDVYRPSLLSTANFDFAIKQVYGFGQYFVIEVPDILKLLKISNNTLEVFEDTLLVLTSPPLFKYPYIIMRRDIYKYVENFGAYQIYFMDYDGDGGMEFQFLAENQVVYTSIVDRPPPHPPSVCGIRARLIQEPDFPFLFINDWWANCLPAYTHMYDGSKRYIYLSDWRIPPNGGRLVVNFAGVTLYQHFSLDYELKLTDSYLFQLGDSIFYSTPSDPSIFYELEYTITSVELTSFTATVNDRDVILNWSTATETNNLGFEVQKKSNGSFNTIKFVEGKGTTTENNNYSYTDTDSETGTYYYRLKQLDYFGNFEYSEEVSVVVSNPSSFALLQNYPNPFNPTTNIEFILRERGIVKLAVTDILGNVIATLVNEEKPAGKYITFFDGSDIPSGVYFYTLIVSVVRFNYHNDFMGSKKMVLIK